MKGEFVSETFEYSLSFDPKRFAAHETFFVGDVAAPA
jgi:hypothetical protein